MPNSARRPPRARLGRSGRKRSRRGSRRRTSVSFPSDWAAWHAGSAMSKVEAIQYGDRKVYAVAAFNRGVAEWLQRLPTVWVEGEVTELRRNARWQSVFFTLKDPN
ncbi:MAG: hypothetical protein E6G18_16015, partial [Actinobacteria bacterium]